MVLVALLTVLASSSQMPVGQQNALVQKYCVSCHTDKTLGGGLSLEHFDAGTAPPSLTAMMLSKMTSGVPLATVQQAATNPEAAALVAKSSKTGAMGASGVPRPDNATTEAFIQALAAHSAGANDWVDGSILREIPGSDAQARAYRLIVTCGKIQVTWSPAASKESFRASVDGKPDVTYQVDGADRYLAATLPSETLTIRDLFPGETVVFPLGKLPRAKLSGCFSPSQQ